MLKKPVIVRLRVKLKHALGSFPKGTIGILERFDGSAIHAFYPLKHDGIGCTVTERDVIEENIDNG